MSAIMLNNAVSTPAIESKTFNELWLSQFQVSAINPNKPVRIVATLDRARTCSNGTKEVLHNGTQVVIEDFFATATTDELQLMYALITALKSRAGI